MIVSYAVIRPPASHVWEYWNAIGFLLAAILTVLARLVAREVWRRRSSDVLLGVALLAAFLLGSIRNMDAIKAQDTSFWLGVRHRHYAAVGAWLKDNARPGSRVAWNEPGTIAYFSGLSVYDDFLVSGPLPSAPEYIFGDARAPAFNRFGRTYRLVRAFPDAAFGPMDLFGRVDP
jgi:hypothetical protein